jgi:hypothetical protein
VRHHQDQEQKWRNRIVKGLRIAALAAMTVLAGCGTEEDRIPLIQVTGKIYRNGKPLPNARVSFMPDVGNKHSTPAVDETGPEGNYMLKFKGRMGVAAGKYKVVVTPAIEVPAGSKIPDEFKDDPVMGQMAVGVGVPGAEKKAGAAVAKKEGSKSEFDATIEENDKDKVLDFEYKG